MEEETTILRERRHPRPEPTSGAGPRGGRRLWFALALVLAVFPLLVGLGHDFYRDDYTWLERAYRAGSSPVAVLTPWKSYEVRSLGQALFSLELAVFGRRPVGFNAVSLLIHLASGVLVGLLARRTGLGRGGALAAALLFVGGFGHYTKPATWACAQVILLSTFLVLAAFVRFVGRAPGGRIPDEDAASPWAGRETRRRFPFLALLLLAAALATHEIVILAPFGLAAMAWLERHPQRRAILPAALLLTAIYASMTLAIHFRHPVAHGSIRTLVGNPFLMAATFLLPPQATQVLEAIIPASNAGALAPAVRVAVVVVGAGILAGLLAAVALSPPGIRRLALVGAFLALPTFAFPMPPGWYEARYLYPLTAFLAPAVVYAVIRMHRAASPAARRLLVAGLAVWCLLVVAGSGYMQWKAYAQGASAGSEMRRTQLEDVLRSQGLRRER